MHSAKKRAVTAFAAVLVCGFALFGCSGETSRTAPSGQQGVSDVLQERAEQEDGKSEGKKSQAAFTGDAKPAYDNVDYDLTSMNSDMVYATVYDMITSPSDYEGKTVRMAGPYGHTRYDETGVDYYYVIIQDATACCAQGLEFVWGDGSHSWPQDYPEDGCEVVVTGKFETYTEGASTYVHLTGSSMQAA